MINLWKSSVFSISFVAILALNPVGALADTNEVPQIVFQVGETLALNVLDREEFEREYQIRSDGTISVPIIGAIKVTGLTEQDVEAKLSGLLNDSELQRGTVTIERKSYIPVYILGSVDSPGNYQYRPGLTAKQALSLAGGRYRDNTANSGLEVKAQEIESQIFVSQSNLADIIAHRARIMAQLSDTETMKITEEFTALAGENANNILREHAKILRQGNLVFEEKISALAAQQSLANSNSSSLGEQVALLHEQISENDIEIERLMDLKERGLAVTERITVANRSANRDKIALMTALSEKATLDLEASKFGSRKQAVQSSRVDTLQKSLNELGVEERRLRAQIKSTRHLLAQIRRMSTEVNTPLITTETHYLLTRGDLIQSLQPNEMLLPGDVVTIEFLTNTSE